MTKFLNCKINLSKRVFKPRIETEYWVGKTIADITNTKLPTTNYKLQILDIFAGTGCIGIAILKACPEFCRRVDFADISKDAIKEIRTNLKLNKIAKGKYRIYKSNLFEKLKNKKYNIIFANPPYVALARIGEVQKGVLEKEPREALFAGRTGMFWIKKLLSQARHYLRKNGKIFLEFDPKQMVEIKRILKKEKLKFKFKKDQFKKFRWLKITF